MERPVNLEGVARAIPPGTDRDRGPWTFVWGIWALLVLATLALVYQYGATIPRTDELGDIVPVLTGDQPMTPAWLWSVHGDHRLPLSRAVLLTLYKLTGCDFRAGAFLSVLLLGALSFLMIRVASGLRGRLRYSDAFFPLAIMNLGQWETLLWGWQAAFVIPVVLVGVLLAVVLKGRPLTNQGILLFGTCLLLLPLCGPTGLPYVLPFAAWLGYLGIVAYFSSSPDKRAGTLMLAFACAAVALLGLYFTNYHVGNSADPSPVLTYLPRASIQLLGMSFGQFPAETRWQVKGLTVLGLLLTSTAILFWGIRKQRPERFRSVGLLLFLGGFMALVLGIGWSRSGFDASYILGSSRYVVLMAPAFCCMYFIWELYSSAEVASFVQMGLFTLMCGILPWNAKEIVSYSKYKHDYETLFMQDLQAGVPASILAERSEQFLFPYAGGRERVARAIEGLHHAGIGAYRLARMDPVYRVEPFPVPPIVNRVLMGDESEAGPSLANDSSLSFALAEPRFVYAIRVRCSYDVYQERRARFHIAWRTTKQANGATAERYTYVDLDRDKRKPIETTVTIWVNDTLDRLSICPSEKPCVFRILEMDLLVPPTS